MKTINPISGKVYFDKHGNLWFEKGLPFGRQLKPKLTPREWFYLLIEACKEKAIPSGKVDAFIQNSLGSSVTQWRTKKSLQEKGYL